MQTSTEPSVFKTIDCPSSISSVASIQSIEFYEAAISLDETVVSNYWYLGVSYLLADREDDAQAAWFVPFSAATPTEAEVYTEQLSSILAGEANYQIEVNNLELAYLLRQHLWTIAPDSIDNIIELAYLAQSLNLLTPELLAEWQLNELLTDITSGSIDESLLDRIIAILLKIESDLSLETIATCLQISGANRQKLIKRIVAHAFALYHQTDAKIFAIILGEICESIDPENLDVLQLLSGLYSGINNYDRSKEIATKYYNLATNDIDKLFAIYLIERENFTAGSYAGAMELNAKYQEIVANIIEDKPRRLNYNQRQQLLVSSFFLPYIEDNPQVNKPLRNELARIYQQNIKPAISTAEYDDVAIPRKPNCLRIGYVGSTFKTHSVGWLCRWLIHHHDRESFQVFIYSINVNQDDKFSHEWFRDKVDAMSYFSGVPDLVVAQIRADEIDILIDLDSLTFDLTCLVMANKPAPVQISWLGWDATGIPAIDYFIADPYVLPETAQNYYQEQIWRLPHTYLAVDGFEVGIPTLRREDLNIPADAVVYLSSQRGYKRHPDNIRSQMKIIKAVPNSYLLIKGKSDARIIQELFGTIAAEEGVSLDRLRFLERDIDEPTHRANLAIADIVLDTFPYNGATTTLETLWMGIPLVTRVGEQFAARNSYTFMVNAGISEGIAGSEAEYIEWGIKLGLDRELRSQIQGKLRSSRSTAPVWNAKQFTREMEGAYREMWAKSQQK